MNLRIRPLGYKNDILRNLSLTAELDIPKNTTASR